MKRFLLLLGSLLILSCSLDNEKEWLNPLDEEGDNYFPPTVTAMDDITVAIYDSVVLYAEAKAGNASVIKYLWSFNNGKTWSVERDTCTLTWSFPKKKAGDNVIWVMAVDSFNIRSDSVNFSVTVKLYKPSVTAMEDTVVPFKDTVLLHAEGTDSNGNVVKYLWSFGSDTNWSEESATGVVKRCFPKEDAGNNMIWVKAVDDDTLESQPDSFCVEVKLYEPIVTIAENVAVNINDSLTLTASGVDSNGVVVKYIWALDGENFTDTTVTNTIKQAYAEGGSHVVKVKAVDDDGFFSEAAKTTITVTLDPPILTPVNNLFVSQNDTVSILVTAEDTNATGTIEKYYWDKNADGWDDSTDTPSYDFYHSEGGPLSIVWGARDDDGLLSTDTFTIVFNRPPTSVSMVEPTNGDTAVFKEFDLGSCKGSVVMHFSGSDPDGSVDTLTYTVYLGKNIGNMQMVYSGRDTLYEKENLDTATTYFWQLRVHDLFGDSAVKDGKFYTPEVDLIPPVITLNGDNPMMLSLGVIYEDPGATAIDNVDGDISDSIKIGGDSVNTLEAGTYEVTYSVEDNVGNDTMVTRAVIVEEYILLEDFETGPTYQSAFGEIFGQGSSDSVGYWRAWSDENTRFEPDPYETDSAFETVVTEGSGVESTRGLHTLVRVYTPQSAYWGLQCFLKEYGEYYDFSVLDSITFYAKAGANSFVNTIRVQFTYMTIDTLPLDEHWGFAGKDIELSDDWEKVIIVPADDFEGLEDSPGEDHDWNTAKTQVRRLYFTDPTYDLDDVDLYLDDIRLYGSFSNHEILKQ